MCESVTHWYLIISRCCGKLFFLLEWRNKGITRCNPTGFRFVVFASNNHSRMLCATWDPSQEAANGPPTINPPMLISSCPYHIAIVFFRGYKKYRNRGTAELIITPPPLRFGSGQNLSNWKVWLHYFQFSQIQNLQGLRFFESQKGTRFLPFPPYKSRFYGSKTPIFSARFARRISRIWKCGYIIYKKSHEFEKGGGYCEGGGGLLLTRLYTFGGLSRA